MMMMTLWVERGVVPPPSSQSQWWTTTQLPDGRTLYENTKTKQCQFTPPTPPAPAPAPAGHAPIDVLLLLAASENDDNKVEEVLRCGADAGVRDAAGRTPRELATKDSVVRMLAEAEARRGVAAR
jgi:hypothetical protein